MTKPKTKPQNILPAESVEDQIARFLAAGGKPQIIPDGVTAETLRDRRGMNELTAAQTLGKRTYASAMARKPKAESRIVIGEDDGDE